MTAPAAHASPRVSVAMITYNHAKFIAQAIESVLMQQAPFPIELVIGEDCSTDGTRAIVEHYARLRPDIVRPLLHTTSQGMHGNFRAVVQACRGEFIACLEGDDYWTDAAKLEKQIELFEAHSELALTFHRVRGVDADGNPLGWDLPEQSPTGLIIEVEDIVDSVKFSTASVIFRGDRLRALDFDRIATYPVGDYPTVVLSCKDGGRIGYIDTYMADYRRHEGGITFALHRHNALSLLKLADMWRDLGHLTGKIEEPAFRRRISLQYSWAARALATDGYSKRALVAETVCLKFSNGHPLQRCLHFLNGVLRIVGSLVFRSA